MPNEQNPVQPNYQAMADLKKERPTVEGAASETQAQLMEMSAGERAVHEQAQAVQRVGGNQGHFSQAARIQQGITTEYEVTDRNLDFDGEEGYPTPT